MTPAERHAAELSANAADTARRAAENPEDWLLQIAARNQIDAAEAAKGKAAVTLPRTTAAFQTNQLTNHDEHSDYR